MYIFVYDAIIESALRLPYKRFLLAAYTHDVSSLEDDNIKYMYTLVVFTVGVHNISLTVILQASLGVPIKEV